MGFASALDIMNRACQHIGTQRIIALTDDTKQSSELQFAYDKQRRAELRRNLWRFSIRQTALRPLTLTTQSFTPGVWAVGTTYSAGDIVLSNSGQYWYSVASGNIGLPPGASNAWEIYFGPLTADTFNATTSYLAGELAISAGVVYLSLVSGNADAPPSTKWRASGGVVTPLSIVYPIGSGPMEDTTSSNVYRLPANYLRQAPLDPKAGSNSYLGAPSGLAYDDWKLQGNYLITSESDVIVFRFGADIYGVPDMDDLFCEGLAAKLGEAVCESITQSNAKIATCTQAYKTAISEARQVNGIETGPVEPPEDDWITCRQ